MLIYMPKGVNLALIATWCIICPCAFKVLHIVGTLARIPKWLKGSSCSYDRWITGLPRMVCRITICMWIVTEKPPRTPKYSNFIGSICHVCCMKQLYVTSQCVFWYAEAISKLWPSLVVHESKMCMNITIIGVERNPKINWFVRKLHFYCSV